MSDPLVSIIIPVYNGSNYMREAIDSAIAQTYHHLEIIVVNDGSNDNGATEQIARSYGDRIRYFYKPNGGVSSALNFGIQQMSGEYFSWLSHDDVYEPDKVENQVAALRNADGNTVACCRYIQIDEKSKAISGRMKEDAFQAGIIYDGKAVLKGLLKGGTLNGCCLLIPKTALVRCGQFDETLRFCQDAFMWYKIFLEGYSLLCCDDYSVRCRIHAKQLTQTGQHIFRRDCAAISDYLAEQFIKASDGEYNFWELYLLCDAKHLPAKQVRKILMLGRDENLVSVSVWVRAYALCLYGKIRPYIRKAYYLIFRKIWIARSETQ